MIYCELMNDGLLIKRAHTDDGGFDLFLAEDLFLRNQTKAYLKIKVLMPMGWSGRIVPRSSSYSLGVEVNGTVDRYTGEIFITVKNSRAASITFEKGKSICQLLPIYTGAGINISKPTVKVLYELLTACNQVEVVKALPKTIRGSKGYGSTGNI
jgi:dUTPase